MYYANYLASAYNTTVSEDETKRILFAGLKRGINYVDTAPWYGQGRSERLIGNALEKVPRKAYYLATKVRQRAASSNAINYYFPLIICIGWEI